MPVRLFDLDRVVQIHSLQSALDVPEHVVVGLQDAGIREQYIINVGLIHAALQIDGGVLEVILPVHQRHFELRAQQLRHGEPRVRKAHYHYLLRVLLLLLLMAISHFIYL